MKHISHTLQTCALVQGLFQIKVFSYSPLLYLCSGVALGKQTVKCPKKTFSGLVCLAEVLFHNIVLVLCRFHYSQRPCAFVHLDLVSRGLNCWRPVVLNVRLSLPSSPGVRSGEVGGFCWRLTWDAPRNGVGTRCCVKYCALCLLHERTPQVHCRRGRDVEWLVKVDGP